MVESSETGQAAIHISAAGMSDMGRVRKNNEDNLVICDLTTGEVGVNPPLRNHLQGPRGTLLMVADGMGGEASGEVASQICVTTVPKRLYDNLKSVSSISETNFVLMLREAIEFANQVIYQKAQAASAHKGMGTTTTAAALFGMDCTIYMGEVDTRRQALNVARMRMLGAEVVQENARLCFISYDDEHHRIAFANPGPLAPQPAAVVASAAGGAARRSAHSTRAYRPAAIPPARIRNRT